LSLSSIYFALDNAEDIVVSFFHMRDDAARAVLDAVPENERAIAFQQIERTPAEKTGFPFFKVMAGIERALLVDKILVVHLHNSSLGNFIIGSG